MGLAAKLQNVSSQLQAGAKNSTLSLFGMVLKVISAFFIAQTLALLGQFMMHLQIFGFLFALVVVFASLLRLMWNQSLRWVIVFDLICFLIALTAHLYVEIAPGVGQ